MGGRGGLIDIWCVAGRSARLSSEMGGEVPSMLLASLVPPLSKNR